MKKVVKQLFDSSDIQINGNRSWDIHVHDPRFYKKVLTGGSIAMGESYMDGWWDCESLDQFFDRIFSQRLDNVVKTKNLGFLGILLKTKMLNSQNKSKAYDVGRKHYDIGNSLFFSMLDERLNYSCGYWAKAQTLDSAQKDKLEMICRKIGLKPGMKVLDVGCGWGGFSKYAAENYGVQIHGITISREQKKYAEQSCLGYDVNVELQDYRSLKGSFDRIVSVGMFEHVGCKNYRTYMKVLHDCLKSDGLFLLHTIGGNTSANFIDPWINKYIFPNAVLPSAAQITKAAEGFFVLEDWHCFGQDYDKTLMAWHENFINSWSQLQDHYDEAFYRMWTYYLLSCAASFRSRRNQVWQIIFSREGLRGGYSYRRHFSACP